MYEFTREMAQISGFGGGYERACRAMVKAGLDWFDAHPDAKPQYRGWKGVYGVLADDNADAKALDAAVVAAAEPKGATGAMHQATVSIVLWVRAHSWAEFVKAKSKGAWRARYCTSCDVRQSSDDVEGLCWGCRNETRQ